MTVDGRRNVPLTRSKQGVEERSEGRRGCQGEQSADDQQDEDQGNEPPLLLMLDKQEEFFDERLLGHVRCYLVLWFAAVIGP